MTGQAIPTAAAIRDARRELIAVTAPASPCWQHIAYQRDHAGHLFGILPPAK